MLFGDRIYSDDHTSAVRLLCPAITAALQQSIHRAPLLQPHFSSPFIVPPLLQPHFSRPVIVPHYYGHTSASVIVPHYYDHTSAVQLQSPTLLTTHQESSYGAPLLRPHRLHSQAPNIIATHPHCSWAPVLTPHTGSPALVSHCRDHINPVMVLPFCGHTGCPVRLPLSWPHIISAVVVLSPTALCIDTEICWSL